MDERNNRAHRKSGSSSSPNKQQQQQQTKFAKWGSGSKFNKILNNIERSILAQFGGPSSSNWSDPHPERHHHHQSRNNHDSLSAQPNTSRGLDQVSPPTKSKSTTSTKSANNKLKPNSSNQSPGAQRDAAHHRPNQTMDRVTSELQQRGGDSKSATLAASTSQPMPANRNGKMILNKYQQQIAAAMQTNKSLPSSAISAGKQSGGGTASSYSHNRLSIPPPHANDEARNQNHRFLLGCPSTQSSDFSTANDQMASIYDQGRVALPISKHSAAAADRQSALFYHNSASPASSAQSLPVTKTGFTQPTQDRSRINATDDEESGFCTYRSRRAAMNVPPSANRFPNDVGKPENSMIFFQANQPPPMGNLTNIKTNTLSPQQQQYQRQQQMFHQNNLLQSRLMQQQSMNNTQQQQLNQVPISQGVMYNSNMKVQYHQNANRPGDFRNPTYGSYGHLGPVPYSQLSLQQQHPPQPLYDGQIYANAPPKPRRYQYYDPSLNFNRNSAALPKAPQNYPPNPATQFISQQVVATPGHQYSSQQVPQLYNQQRNELINASGCHVPYRPQRQLPMLPHPPTLTKSKSSLDVADLSRFKQDSMLRVQPHCSNVPIYGSTRFINQIEPSTLQRNPNRQPTIESNLQQQQSTHLQRSKSIGNLLPDYNTHGLNITQRNLAPFSTANHHLPLQQSNALAYPKFLTVSSASTSNLNYMDSSPTMLMNTSTHSSRQASQTMQEITRQDGNNDNNSIQTQQQYLATQKNPLSPMYQNHQRLFNNEGSLACRPNQHQNRGATYYNNGDGDTIKANINTISNSGKVAREAQNGSISYAMPPADGTSIVAQSLDDKIRHLLIGDDSISGGGAISKSNKTESPRQVAAWHAQQPSHSLISKQSQLSQEETPSTQLKPSTSKLFLNKQPGIEPENDEKLASEEIHHPNADMGNRHQRQYQVAGGSSGGYPDQETMIDQRNNGNHCDSLSTNSQLIVDLTTPRVLAKTQTTLLPISSQTTNPQTSIVQQSKPQEAWSMNQLGLPTRYVEQCVQNSQLSSQYRNPEVQNKIEATDASNFSAPYYYSDLKSEEQRRALFNIVQQKSLSPPPQLLSRSIDQSNTRLAPKSATMHAAQARMLSETLAASHRQLQLRTSLADSKSATNLTGISSNSTVAKNIDKLFESPVDPRLNQSVQNKLYSVQSMLTLSNNPAAQESCSMISSEQIQIESLSNSSGYCSDALKKTGSKSKSLENISQQQLQLSHNVTASIDKTNVGEKLKQHGNPVYENIRRSDKLLSAINNSTTCLSTSSTRNRKPRSSLPPTRPQPTSGSDSMDSILGSSFDEVDDESEENPADFDSDTSVTGIDFIKLSPTTADMSELIEQLKNNHSKLTDEYKSTLARISKILNRKDSSGKRKISDKLASRLQRLEQKSKKCESRSKNQLALIQMMEKAIRQSQRESPDKSPANKTAAGQHDATESLALVDAAHNKTNDSNDLVECPQTDQTSPACPSTSPRQSSDHQDADHKSDRHSSSDHKQPPPPPPPVLEAHNAIKAIVTEATSVEVPRKFVAELCNQQTQPRGTLANKTDEPVSLSTRFQQNKTQDRASKDNHSRPKSDGTVGQRIQIIESIVKRNGTNPFKSDKPDSPVGATLNNGGAQTKRRNSGAFHDELGDDEDDFIEFLSTGSSSTHGRSQFESSQFSASDFNNSSSSGSTSVSSHSESVTTDSLDLSSPPATTKSEQADNRSKNSVGILKSGSTNSKSSDDKSNKKEHSSSTNNNSEDEHSKIYQKSNGNNSSKRDEKARGDNKFKNVLGNVIDVDVYPVNTNHPAASS